MLICNDNELLHGNGHDHIHHHGIGNCHQHDPGHEQYLLHEIVQSADHIFCYGHCNDNELLHGGRGPGDDLPVNSGLSEAGAVERNPAAVGGLH